MLYLLVLQVKISQFYYILFIICSLYLITFAYRLHVSATVHTTTTTKLADLKLTGACVCKGDEISSQEDLGE